MDESTTRRREVERSTKAHKFTITEELMILASLRKKIYKILDPLSVAIRACILADLNYQNIITMDYNKGCVVVKGNSVLDNSLMDDVAYRIGLYRASASKWVRLLNGESYKRSEFYLKKVRKRVLVELQSKNAVKFESKFCYKVDVNRKVREELTDRLVMYVDDKGTNVRDDVLLVALEYSGCLGIVFSGCSKKFYERLKGKLVALRKSLKDRRFIGDDHCVMYEVMKFMFKDR